MPRYLFMKAFEFALTLLLSEAAGAPKRATLKPSSASPDALIYIMLIRSKCARNIAKKWNIFKYILVGSDKKITFLALSLILSWLENFTSCKSYGVIVRYRVAVVQIMHLNGNCKDEDAFYSIISLRMRFFIELISFHRTEEGSSWQNGDNKTILISEIC